MVSGLASRRTERIGKCLIGISLGLEQAPVAARLFCFAPDRPAMSYRQSAMRRGIEVGR
jgi:hypothetical protein